MKISGKRTFLIGLFIIISSCAGIWAENKTIALDSDHVKKIGRTYEHSNGLVLAYSASGIEFNVKSKYLGVTIAGDSGASGHETDSSARIVAFVNGERFLDKLISKKSETFTIFDEDKNREGLVQILKVSESANSLQQLHVLLLMKMEL